MGVKRPFKHLSIKRISFILFYWTVASAAAFTVTPPTDSSAARSRAEALCGPEIVLLGDAWEHVQLERDELIEITQKGDLVLVPQKLASLYSHLAFMENRAVMVFGEQREVLLNSIAEVNAAIPRWNALALEDHGEKLNADWPLLTQRLRTIGAQFPDEALVSSSEASFVLPPVVPTLQIKLSSPTNVEVGKPSAVRFYLIGPGNVPVIPDQLHTTHTEKLHALLLSSSFHDYQHEHPQPTENPGEYEFTFIPQHDGPYRMWLDVMPVATGRGEFPIADLRPIPRPILKAPAPPAPITEVVSGKFRARLKLPEEGLSFGNVGAISVHLEENNSPLTRVEPLMGAFAHVVGFADDFQSILHIHPTGKMPEPGQLGGPRVDFQLRPLLPGWLRLYFQYQVDGELHLAEFIVPVTVK